MLFLKPKWMNKDEDKAYNYVEGLTDQALLLKAATDSPHEPVRCIAVSKLRDIGQICEIAKNDTSADVRKTAVEMIDDQSFLSQIALHDPAGIVRKAAIDKLEDQDALYEVAMSDPSTIYHNTNAGGLLIYHLRLEAIHKLKSQEHLYEIAVRSDEISSSATAAECITQEKYLCAIVIQYILSEASRDDERASECCRSAMKNENLNNQKLFEKIIESSSPSWLKCLAIQKMTNKDTLLSIAKNDPTIESVGSFSGKYYPLREEAQRRLLYLRNTRKI